MITEKCFILLVKRSTQNLNRYELILEKKFRKILNEGKDDGKFNFENSEIVFNIIIKSLSWSYEAVKKYKREDLESELSDFILNALNK